MEKPTGDADCPPEVNHAHEIDAAMNNKAGTISMMTTLSTLKSLSLAVMRIFPLL
jgi:hypothetical protein